MAIATPGGGLLDLRSMVGEVYVTLHAIFAAEENRKRAERVKVGKLSAIADLRSRVDDASLERRRELALSLIPVGGVAVATERIEVNVCLTQPPTSGLATSLAAGSS